MKKLTGLEALEKIKPIALLEDGRLLEDTKSYRIIKKELKNGKKCKKALELLIKKYGFRVYEAKDILGNEHRWLTTHFHNSGFFNLTEKEYNLLKEVLEDE